MNFYQENGYLNSKLILDLRFPFNFVITPRGTGKTYNFLSDCRKEGRTVLFLRRTQNQCDIISRKAMNPYASIAHDQGWDFQISSVTKGIIGVDEIDDEGNVLRNLCFVGALSTISNVRGFDASSIDTILFDEFIPERHERPIKNECDALLNCFETVNRNRELGGKPPVQLVCMANANRLDSPILMGLGLLPKVESMLKKDQQCSLLPEKGVALFLLSHSPISAQKAKTALYRLTEGTRFAEMALDNGFAYSDQSGVKSLSLDGMQPMLIIDDIEIYRHKENRQLYASSHISGSPPEFSSLSAEKVRQLQAQAPWLYYQLLQDNLTFESFEIKAKLLSIYRLQ